MARLRKPMKLVTLRIDEDEKERLESLAERRDVTLSRAFREGAILFLSGLVERAKDGPGAHETFHGIRRDREGRRLTRRSAANKTDTEHLRELREALHERALGSIREAWEARDSSDVVVAALGQWLGLVGYV